MQELAAAEGHPPLFSLLYGLGEGGLAQFHDDAQFVIAILPHGSQVVVEDLSRIHDYLGDVLIFEALQHLDLVHGLGHLLRALGQDLLDRVLLLVDQVVDLADRGVVALPEQSVELEVPIKGRSGNITHIR